MKAKLLVGVVLLLTATVAFGQSNAPATSDKPRDNKLTKKSELELALEDALKNNPDLRVALARAAEADAQLARARAQVVQKVVAAYQAIERAKATLAAAEATLARMKKLYSTAKAVPLAEIEAAEATVAQAKASLASAESDMEYLTGKSKHAEKVNKSVLEEAYKEQRSERARYVDRLVEREWALSKGPTADRVRKALEKKGRFVLRDLPARKVLELIQTEAERSKVHVQANTKGEAWDQKITATLDDAPLSTVLQLLEDTLENHHVVIREYGLLVVPRDKLPPSAVTLGAFLRSKADDSAPKKVEPIMGKITKVDQELVTLSVGSDAGLEKGSVLEVYRLGDKPRYLGKIKIVQVMAKTAVGQVQGKVTEALEVDDEVSTALTSPK